MLIKILKKIVLTIIITTCFLFGINSAVLADDETIYGHGYFEYKIIDGGVAIVGYLVSQDEVTVPSQIAGLPVYCIEKNAFRNCEIEVLNLPDTITTIEEGALNTIKTVNFNGSVFSDEVDNHSEKINDEDVLINEDSQNSEESSGIIYSDNPVEEKEETTEEIKDKDTEKSDVNSDIDDSLIDILPVAVVVLPITIIILIVVLIKRLKVSKHH